VLLFTTTAVASPLDIGLFNNVPAGQKPSLTLVAKAALRSVEVNLTRTEDEARFTPPQAADEERPEGSRCRSATAKAGAALHRQAQRRRGQRQTHSRRR